MTTYEPEGSDAAYTAHTLEDLERAQHCGIILESRALACDTQHTLRFRLGPAAGLMPREECALGVREGTVRDAAILARVGRKTCFVVERLDFSGEQPRAFLSRAEAQRRCQSEYLDTLHPGDLLSCRVTHMESFGAFCDVGCGVSALLPIDSMSVSRISRPQDRLRQGQLLTCVLRKRDEQNRLVLTLRELLGTWEENVGHFSAGDTVIGVVRSTEPYGVFVELAPNLAGLAEATPGLIPGQVVSVYIKSILPERLTIKSQSPK